jgi:hypothetical protein
MERRGPEGGRYVKLSAALYDTEDTFGKDTDMVRASLGRRARLFGKERTISPMLSHWMTHLSTTWPGPNGIDGHLT